MDFIDRLTAFRKSSQNIVIPDIKCRSPKEGDLLNGRKPFDIAKRLVQSGAPVLSVVTEEKHFGGSKASLREIAALGVPVLRKDFLKTKEDIYESKSLGAAAVLLMYSCLDDSTLSELYHEAKQIGLDVLVETHTADELKRAAALGAKLIGINNRNISILEKDDGTVSLTEQLAIYKPSGSFLISESSIQSPEDVRRAIKSGADAVLVGTALLRADEPGAFYQKMSRKVWVKLCGMMSEENMRLCSQADILGFVTEYPEPVPWNLSEEKTKLLLSGLPSGCKSCVVTGGASEKVIRLAKTLQPDYIQLHHKENLNQTEQIVSALSKMGIKVIRSIPCSEAERQAQFGLGSLNMLSEAFANMGVAELLVDSRNAEHAADKSRCVPIDSFQKAQACRKIPVILAGGITPWNVKAVLAQSGTDRIDILSGIEESPGIKSHRAIEELWKQIGG